jgi:DNA-binding HxlR family transcriptional regulator
LNNNQAFNSFEYAISLVGGKWKMSILYRLGLRDTLRYGELKRSFAGISHKMLSKQLKELEQDGLILRKEYPQVPPKVEYSISDKAITLMPILMSICDWGAQNHNKEGQPC